MATESQHHSCTDLLMSWRNFLLKVRNTITGKLLLPLPSLSLPTLPLHKLLLRDTHLLLSTLVWFQMENFHLRSPHQILVLPMLRNQYTRQYLSSNPLQSYPRYLLLKQNLRGLDRKSLIKMHLLLIL